MKDTYEKGNYYEYPAAQVSCSCAHCGSHIYIGDTAYELDKQIIHSECLSDFFEDQRFVVEE